MLSPYQLSLHTGLISGCARGALSSNQVNQERSLQTQISRRGGGGGDGQKPPNHTGCISSPLWPRSGNTLHPAQISHSHKIIKKKRSCLDPRLCLKKNQQPSFPWSQRPLFRWKAVVLSGKRRGGRLAAIPLAYPCQPGGAQHPARPSAMLPSLAAMRKRVRLVGPLPRE